MSIATQFTPPAPLQTAVLFLVFSRLDTTKQVFESIRKAKPPRLYIAADGPRENKDGEVEKVAQVRHFVTENVDWDCEVKTLFRETNLGCKNAVSSAITWFFENEEQGIILEDDCLPSQSFFWYCEELLEKYKNNKDIYLVSGDARGPESFGMMEDYTFCKYPLIWGWASWSRVWKDYDVDIKDWPIKKQQVLANVSANKRTQRFWQTIFNKMFNKEIDTWDYQFTYLLLKNKGKSIVPRVNMISNIGFGAEATHTVEVDVDASNRKRFDLDIPLTHRVSEMTQLKVDDFFDKTIFTSPSFFKRALNKIRRLTGI